MKHLTATVILFSLLVFLTACGAPPTPTPTLTPTATSTPTATPTPTNTSTPSPTATRPIPQHLPTTEPSLLLTPSADRPWIPGWLWLFPSGTLYAGDQVTMEIPFYNLDLSIAANITYSVDGGDPQTEELLRSYNPVFNTQTLILSDAWMAQPGEHTLRLQGLLGDHYAFDLSSTFNVLPASSRPLQEVNAAWEETTTDCCTVHYISGTAAERDIPLLSDLAQTSYETAAGKLQLPEEKQHSMTFILIDNVWGNGGYSSEEGIVISYIDRNYTPNQADTWGNVFLHEATHAAYDRLNIDPLAGNIFTEGTAVYLTGGHFKPDPLRQRASALRQLDGYIPLETLANDFVNLQHESRYLESAAVVQFIVEKYGWEAYLTFLETDLKDRPDTSAEWLDLALQENFSISRVQFETDFTAWLDAVDPGTQVDDLRLTIRLQDVRRRYQAEYVPSQEIYLHTLLDWNELADLIREPNQPFNIAIETLIQNAQEVIIHADYAAAETLTAVIEQMVDRDDFSNPLAADYLAVARQVSAQGWTVDRIEISGGIAVVTVNRNDVKLQTLTLEKQGVDWVIR